ncbi:MAG TPA: hypothetical protein VIT88_15315 [Pyrinomonadaceae bacterium]
MTIARLPLLLTLLVACWASASAQPSTSLPKTTAEEFYGTYIKFQIRGLPGDEELKALSPMLAPSLKQLFENAARVKTKYIQDHPDEKPPWHDGDLFTSLFEGAQSFKVGTPRMRGNRAQVPIELVFNGEGSTTRWSDTLVLVRSNGRWLVWDILFKGEWAFKQGSSLRGVLKSD